MAIEQEVMMTERYHNPNPKINVLDIASIIIAIVMPLTALPQAFKILRYQLTSLIYLL